MRRRIVVSAGYNRGSFYPSIVAQWPGISAEGFKGSPMADAYQQLAPDPKHWPVFVNKMKTMMLTLRFWRSIASFTSTIRLCARLV